MHGPRIIAVYMVLAPNSFPISSQARIRSTAFIAVTMTETFTMMPAFARRALMTIARPVILPTTSWLGSRK